MLHGFIMSIGSPSLVTAVSLAYEIYLYSDPFYSCKYRLHRFHYFVKRHVTTTMQHGVVGPQNADRPGTRDDAESHSGVPHQPTGCHLPLMYMYAQHEDQYVYKEQPMHKWSAKFRLLKGRLMPEWLSSLDWAWESI